MKQQHCTISLLFLTLLVFVACGSKEPIDYWGQDKQKEEQKNNKETGEEKVILFNLSGHGLIDMASYDKYLAGDLVNYSLTDEDIQKNLDEIGDLAK